MPLSWISLLLLPPAAGIVREDVGCRRVSVVCIILLGGAAFVAGCIATDWRTTLTYAGCNAAVLLLLTACLWVWMRLRGKTLRHGFGSGDLAAAAATAPYFAPICYVRFLIVACAASLVWWCACGMRRRRTIPFAGILCGVLIVYTLYDIFVR